MQNTANTPNEAVVLSQFKNYCGEEVRALIIPVKNQTGLDGEDFFNELRNVANSPCGAAGGYSGFIWYTDTVKFYRKNRARILKLVNYFVDACGEPNTLAVVMGFNSIKGNYSEDEVARALYGRFNEDLTQIYNTLAWFALEEVAYQFGEFEYEQEHNNE